MGYQGSYYRLCTPFLRGTEAVYAYRILSIVTLLFSIITYAFYCIYKLDDAHGFWTQSSLHSSPFTMNPFMGTAIWVALFCLQLAYLTQLFSGEATRRYEATRVCSYFIINNVLNAIFVALFAHSHFRWSEVTAVVNFINLSALYFRHHGLPWCIHWPTVCCPLSWTFVTIYWNGFVMIPQESQVAVQIIGVLFACAILAYALFYLFLYGDHIMAVFLSILSTSIFVGQVQRLASIPEMISPLILAALLLVAVALSIRFPRLGRRAQNTEKEIYEKDSCSA